MGDKVFQAMQKAKKMAKSKKKKKSTTKKKDDGKSSKSSKSKHLDGFTQFVMDKSRSEVGGEDRVNPLDRRKW